MTKTVIGCGQCSFDTATLTNNAGNGFTAYGAVGGPICIASWQGAAPAGTAASGVLNNHGAYTSSGMCIMMTSTSANLSADIVHQLLINSTSGPPNGNQVVRILCPANNGGNIYANGTVIQDATHTDTVAAGVPVALSQGWTGTGGTGQAIMSSIFWQADQPGGVSVPFSSTPNHYNDVGGTGTTTPHFLPVTGGSKSINTTSVMGAQVMMPTAGTWSGLQLNVVAPLPGNAHTQTTTFNSCVSPTLVTTTTTPPGNQVLTIFGDVGVGILDDATGTDAVPAGSFINTVIVDHLSGNLFYSSHGSTWTSTAQNVTPLTCVDIPTTSPVSGSNRAQVGYTAQRIGAVNPNEQPAPFPTAGTVSGLNVTFTASTASGGSFQSTIGFSQTAGNQTAAIGTGSGQSTDATHSDALPANTNFTVTFANLSGFALASQSANFTTPAPAGGANPSNMLLLDAA